MNRRSSQERVTGVRSITDTKAIKLRYRSGPRTDRPHYDKRRYKYVAVAVVGWQG